MSYTSSSPYTTSWTFQNLVNADLSFSSIVSTEVDYGNFTSFTDSAPEPYAIATPYNLTNPNDGLLGMEWGGFAAGVTGPNSSTTFTINYNLDVTNPAEAITSLEQLYVVDTNVGPGTSATATEQAYDSSGNLIATLNWSAATGASSSVALATGYQHLHIVLTVNESISSIGTTSAIDISTIDQNFGQSLETPGVSIVKSVTSVGGVTGDPAATTAGEAIDYSVVVTNTGNETLTNVVVTDPTLGTTLGTLASLAVGASVTYTTSQAVTQAELDSGNAVTNTATVTDTQTPSESSTVSTGVTQTPGVSIVKSVTSVGGVAGDPTATTLGEAIDYSVVVTNTGNETLTNVVVLDTTLGTTLGTLASLAVGASGTYTASQTVTQAELNTGTPATNTATVTDTQNVTGSSTAITSVAQQTGGTGTPDVSIVKTVTSVGGVAGDPAATYAGEVIDYQIVVTNTGTEALTNVVVTDPTLGTTLGTLASLAVGATATYTASQTVTQAEIDSAACGTAYTASGTGCDGPESAIATITPGNNEITVTLSSEEANPTAAGQEVSGIQFTLGSTPASASLASASGTLIDIASGGAVTPDSGTITHWGVAQSGATLTLATAGTGSVGGKPIDLIIGSGPYTNANPSITGRDPQIVGPATFVLSAPGVTSATTIGSVAMEFGTGPDAVLAGTQACAPGGDTITNTATVTDSQNVTASSTASTSVTQTPDVSIVKTVTSVGGVAGDPAATYAGEAIDYKIVVTNTGNETLTNVVVTDTTLGTTLGTLASLAVGATATYTASQTVTQAEINQITGTSTGCGGSGSGGSGGGWSGGGWSGSGWSGGGWSGSGGSGGGWSGSGGSGSGNLTNTAMVTDSQNVTATSTASTVLTVAPGVSIVKTVASVNGVAGDPAATAAGQVIDYNIVVINTGSETLTNVVVTDPTLDTTLGTLASLAAGATHTYTASQTVTQAEIDSGNAVTNTAVVTDTQTPSESSTASTGVTQTPGVSILKTVTSVGGVAGDPTATTLGEAIDYSVVVTNTGNETLTNVVVLDTTLGTTLGTLASLAPGASATYTASQTVTQAELNTGTAATNTATVTDTQNVTGSSTAVTSVAQETGGTTGGLTVIKLPSQVVVGTNGQVTYTFDVTNTGSAALGNVHITDNIGTAANPDYITPVLQTPTTNGVLAPGQTWVYTATLNESGDYTSKGGTQSCAVSGQDLGSGSTAWLNSSFTPTSTEDGATYTFKNISCTISGSGSGSVTVNVPNACVTFSRSCTQATTTYNASENSWITTLPANSNPGNVFLSGLPYEIPSGSSLSGATVSWNIGESANNAGSSSVSWQTGCTGYSSFSANGSNGQADYNQIGVKACDNLSGYGNGGDANQGYGWNIGDSGSYSGGGNGYGSNWNGSGTDSAGTPENQYTGSNCSSGNSGGNNGYGGGNNGYGGGSNGYGGGSNGYGGGSNGYGGGSNGYGGGNNGYGGGSNGDGGNGGSSGTVSCGQLGDSSEADTATVTATTLGRGFSLGDAANYGIIAFAPNALKGASNSPINGNVGVGESCGSVAYKLGGAKITGNLVATGATPGNTGGTVTGSTTGNSATLSADIAALQALSLTLASETGTSEKLTSGMTINASSGTLDSAGDYVFTITQWANNITINGTGSNNVVLNFASGVTPTLDNVTLTGGITANEVLFNDQNTGTIAGTSGDTFNGTFLAPNATFNVTGVTVDGHLYGGASGQTFSFTSGATLNAPANTSTGTPTISTVTASDSTEVQVLASNSPITENGTAPTGSLSSLYGTAEKIEFAYNPSNTVSLKQIQAGLASVTGSNTNSMAFLEVSNSSNPYTSGASIYFEGEVQSGEKIYADATLNQLTNTPVLAPNNHFSTVSGADIYAYVFASQAAFRSDAAPIQTMAYNTSGSQAMHLGDQIGSLTVVGYVGAAGGHLVS